MKRRKLISVMGACVILLFMSSSAGAMPFTLLGETANCDVYPTGTATRVDSVAGSQEKVLNCGEDALINLYRDRVSRDNYMGEYFEREVLKLPVGTYYYECYGNCDPGIMDKIYANCWFDSECPNGYVCEKSYGDSWYEFGVCVKGTAISDDDEQLEQDVRDCLEDPEQDKCKTKAVKEKVDEIKGASQDKVLVYMLAGVFCLVILKKMKVL